MSTFAAIEAGVDGDELREAAHHDARAGEEHECQRQLDDDEHVASR